MLDEASQCHDAYTITIQAIQVDSLITSNISITFELTTLKLTWKLSFSLGANYCPVRWVVG